jgi:hypothetical protein
MKEKKQNILGIGLICYLLLLNIIIIPTKNFNSIAELENWTLTIDLIGILSYLSIVGIVYCKKIKKA